MSGVRATNTRARAKSRSSVTYCRERYNCSGLKVVAAYNCEDCRTLQCVDCERKLHEYPRFAGHHRIKLIPPAPEQLCQHQPLCVEQNFADIVCYQCERIYCFDCDSKLHSGVKRVHKRVALGTKSDSAKSEEKLSENSGTAAINSANQGTKVAGIESTGIGANKTGDIVSTGTVSSVSTANRTSPGTTVSSASSAGSTINTASGNSSTAANNNTVATAENCNRDINITNDSGIGGVSNISGANTVTKSTVNIPPAPGARSTDISADTAAKNTPVAAARTAAPPNIAVSTKIATKNNRVISENTTSASTPAPIITVSTNSAALTEVSRVAHSPSNVRHPPIAIVAATSITSSPEEGQSLIDPRGLGKSGEGDLRGPDYHQLRLRLSELSNDEPESFYELAPGRNQHTGSGDNSFQQHFFTTAVDFNKSFDEMAGNPVYELGSPLGSTATIEPTKLDRNSRNLKQEVRGRGLESPTSSGEGFVGWSAPHEAGRVEGAVKKNSAMIKPTSSRDSTIDNMSRMISSSITIQEPHSFELANQHEELLVHDEEEFIDKLGCEPTASCKVISIFGNTGDGKSHTLNHTFFQGHEVFRTSPMQTSCTIGVWCVYDPVHGAILLDTEGLLGVSSNHNQRTRLLLKVLAISDIVIYRTRSERLHSDLFQFLGDASDAFGRHFQVELNRASKRMNLDSSVSSLCPTVIIFHETQHTEIVTKGASEPAEKFIRDRFKEMGLGCKAFSAIQYVGTRTSTPPTDFKDLLIAANKHLRNNDIRIARMPGVIFRTLKVLNEKFCGPIDRELPHIFPDQYFTCRVKCLACGTRCCSTMNHVKDGEGHRAHEASLCTLQAQYDNGVYTCKSCFLNRGKSVVVVPKTCASSENSWFGLASYAWSGYVLECPNCGVIYRSRQHWYGNTDPEKTVVRTEIRHVWPDSNTVLMGTHNAARRVFDGLNYVSGTIAGVGAKPVKFVSSWVTDQIAPPYWRPNSEIMECYKCKVQFTDLLPIHHCRKCGEGFCDNCSSRRRPVPERNWGLEPVRVCDLCYELSPADQNSPGSNLTDQVERMTDPGDPSQLMPRKVGEAIGSTVGALASVINYPYAALRDAARPTYWVADEKITNCVVCKEPFGPKLALHHCRGCGDGVCDGCSPIQRPVPSRGWDHPVRVCKTCFNKAEL